MMLFIVGLIMFLGVHSVSIVGRQWRKRQIDVRGERLWKGMYSIVSLVGFVLLVYGYGAVRHDSPVLYSPPAALRHLALLVMLPVFPLLVAAYLPGRISRLAKHPMLLAVKFWALAHLLANGTLVDVVLFGAFLAWAVADRISVKRRPVDVAHGAPAVPARPINDVLVVVIGLAIYAAFLFALHRWLIGVSPLS